jgi:hypothetical protein
MNLPNSFFLFFEIRIVSAFFRRFRRFFRRFLWPVGLVPCFEILILVATVMQNQWEKTKIFNPVFQPYRCAMIIVEKMMYKAINGGILSVSLSG